MYFPIDKSQTIHINSQFGKLTIKLEDILWAVGEDTTKKIRLRHRGGKPIASEVNSKDDIKVYKDGKELSIPFKSIIVFINDEKNERLADYFRDYDASLVYEYTGGLKVSTCKSTKPNITVFLLPENLEGTIKISNPRYPEKIKKGDTPGPTSFDITLDIEGDENFSNLQDKATSLGFCDFFDAEGKNTGKPAMVFDPPIPLSKVEGTLPKSMGSKGTVKLTVSTETVSSQGYLYIYLTTIKNGPPVGPEQIKTLKTLNGEPVVFIHRTVSNVLLLPVTIE